MNWTHRIAAAGGATVMALALATTTAHAQTTPPAKPTFDVSKVCQQRIPKLETKANKLLTRITGGADVAGSAANLRARAERARTAGNQAQADWLTGKAEHRDARAATVKDTLAKLAAYKQKHCGK